MTTPSGNGQPAYVVSFVGRTTELIRELQLQAAFEGRGDAFAQALAAVIRRLKSKPRTFGEPVYRLPALRLQVRLASIAPVVVYFGVSQDHPIVYVNAVRLMPQ
jgi:hypothetical protein